MGSQPKLGVFRPHHVFDLLDTPVDWAVSRVGTRVPLSELNVETDLSAWATPYLLRRQSIMWLVNPLVARQAVIRALVTWVESPLDSQHLFLIPPVIQRDYGCINKHVSLVEQFHPLPPMYGVRTKNVPFILFH
jgi:hypothetical protein